MKPDKKPKRQRIEDLLKEVIKSRKRKYQFFLNKPLSHEVTKVRVYEGVKDFLETKHIEYSEFSSIMWEIEDYVELRQHDKIAVSVFNLYVSSITYDIFKKHYRIQLTYD